MLRTTVGQLLVNRTLPKDLQDHSRVLDKKSIAALLRQVAEKHPEKYREVAKKLSDVGRDAAYTSGGHSFGIRDLVAPPSAVAARLRIAQGLKRIHANPKWDEKRKNEEIVKLVGREQETLEESIFEESKAEGNPLAAQIASGARGNKMNLKSLRGGDLLYVDNRSNVIPVPVTKSYSEGLTPVQYFAGGYGARKGITDLKFATQDAGFFSKQLNQATHRLLVTALDDPDDDGSTLRGYPSETTDKDNVGALLAQPVGEYPRNTIITPKILRDLEDQGIEDILVRSPLTGSTPEGGVYARDVGVREKGKLAPIGDYVGMAAAQALSEPLTQAQISSKHTGGVAGAGNSISGFKYINQLVQVPKTFKGGAAHAQLDGRVDSVAEAPQGGHFVTISGQKHYVGTGYDVKVKRGDVIEGGDVISAGIPNPAEIVKHKGIGEGRRYFVGAFQKALKDSNISAERRNIELLTRGLINHVRLTDEVGDWVPDDVLPYNMFERNWTPREGATLMEPSRAVGKYLERPVLHYSIGTQLRPSMLDKFKRFGVANVEVHNDPPPFKSEMIRGLENVTHDPDWMTKMLGSYQQKSLLRSTHRGLSSDPSGTSYVPALAQRTEFGRSGLTQGPDAG